MEDIVRGVLAGIAFGGFTATMIKANVLALKALWYVNSLSAETAWEMVQGVERQQLKRERERRQRVKTILEMPEGVDRQQLERERERELELWELRRAAAENSET